MLSKTLKPAQSFVLCSFIILDGPDPNVFNGSLSNICRDVFVLCRVTVKKVNEMTEQWVS